MDPADVLDRYFPDALGALVTGSVARGEDTPTSDVDLLVLLSGPPAPMRRTDRVDGRLVEFFVHTGLSFHMFADQEVERRRSPLLHMCAHGTVIRDRSGCMTDLRADATERWAAGPAALTGSELEDRRYRLTTLLDDLADEADVGAVAALVAATFADVADLALATRGRWSGQGRWLARRLREADDVLAARLVGGLRSALDGDTAGLLRVGRDELRRAGGPLDDGYVRYAALPDAELGEPGVAPSAG